MSLVLVTGGAGYVGSHACKALARAGHIPVTYDNLERGHSELVKWGPLEVGDLHDRQRLQAVLERYRPKAVMHFASLILVGESVSQPALYQRNIVEGTRSLLTAMEAADIASLIVSSSCAVYGMPQVVPITEEAPCRPVNPYGHAKLEMEGLLAEAEEAWGLTWAALRYFNAAGADPECETGEWHDPETHLIPRVLDVAAGRAEFIEIYGSDYPTPDGTCIRDYVHVSDLADAHLLAWRYCISGQGGRAFNLGTHSGSSVLEVVDAVQRQTGCKIRVAFKPRRAGDAPTLIADAARAHQLLGWRPQRSALMTQVADAWRWHCALFPRS